VRGVDGTELSHGAVIHTYRFADGLIVGMDIAA
jgi:hypothetical protein